MLSEGLVRPTEASVRTPPPVSRCPLAPQPGAASSRALGRPWRESALASPAHGRGAIRPSPHVADSSGSLHQRWLIFLQYLKTEATNCTSQRGRPGPTLLYLVLRSQSDLRMPARMVGEGPGAPAHVPGSGAWRALVPAPGACREGSAVGAEAGGPPGSRAAGKEGGLGVGGWMAVEPPETLTFAVTWGHTW